MDLETAKELLNLDEPLTKEKISQNFDALATTADMPTFVKLKAAKKLLLGQLKSGSTVKPDSKESGFAETEAVVNYLSNSNRNQIILGAGGTGKSKVIEKFAANSRAKGEEVLICAFTGLAAMNVKGETIHSFFGFPAHSGLSLKTWTHLSPLARQKFQIIDVLIIDEISMVSADCLDAIDNKLRAARSAPDKPFGGIRVLLLGDPYQLPPVPDKKDALAFAEMVKKYPMGNWFFEARAYEDGEFEEIEIVINKRVLADDDAKKYKAALDEVRVGVCSPETLNTINNRVTADSSEWESEIISIFPRKDQVKDFNQSRLDAIVGDVVTFTGKVGYPDPRRKQESEETWPDDVAPEKFLHIKIGAEIMFIKNDDQGGEVTVRGKKRRWSNGDRGIVQGIKDEDTLIISRLLKDEGKSKTENKDIYYYGEPFEVRRSTWEEVSHFAGNRVLIGGGLKPGLDPHVVKTYTQFPIRLAWAITIHKSQGQTYSAVRFTPEGVFAHGQTYVALSRCTKLSRMKLLAPISQEDLKVDPAVTYFMDNFNPLTFADREKPTGVSGPQGS